MNEKGKSTIDIRTFSQRLKSPTLIFFVCLIAVSAIVGLRSAPYFAQKIFYLDGLKYAPDHKQDRQFVYRGGSGAPTVEVRVDSPERRTVLVDKDSFEIREIGWSNPTKYSVDYPDGRTFTVEDQNGTLLAFDESGELYFPASMAYVNGKRIIADGEERYMPSSLVTAAYPAFHEAQGLPIFLFLALAAIVYGWCCFRYEKFQNFLFFVSPRRLWFQDPEPSDFHFFTCKVGGAILMIASVPIAFKAY